MSRVCMLGSGSRGDIQPLLVIGAELEQRGHSVVITVPADLSPWAARTGLAVVSLPSRVNEIVHAPRFAKAIARGAQAAALSRIAELHRMDNAAIVQACMHAGREADVVVSSTFMLYRGRCVSDATGAAHMAVTMFPFHPTPDFASFGAPAADLGLGALNLLSHQVFYGAWWESERPSIEEMCEALGIRSHRQRPRVESVPTVCCFSEVLVPQRRQWPQQEMVGWPQVSFDLRERLGEAELPSGLEAWLNAGPAPVCVGFGSAPIVNPEATMEVVRRVTRELGLRSLIVSTKHDLGRAVTDDTTSFITGALDFDRVLPRCRAAVHHGGSGTTGDVLRSGIPSVIVSIFTDQPLWGCLVERAGVGTTLPFRELSASRLRSALRRALAPDVVARAKELGARVRAERAAERAADFIEAGMR